MKINKLKEKLLTLVMLAVLVVIMYVLEIRCFYKILFGISCPGCGITRACIRLLQLDFLGAFQLNPMVWSVPILALLYLLDGRLFRKKWLNALILIGILSGFIVCWIVRLITG